MEDTRISWLALALMTFTSVWGFGNITNGFVYFNGIKVIITWIAMFILYFIPYALMVGELGSSFKTESGGVSSWLNRTAGAKTAYYAGWTYWASHVTYIASKGTGCLKALAWTIFRNAETYDTFPTLYVQLASFAVLIICCLIVCKGINPLKKLLTIAGTSVFILSILYILMVFTAPLINPAADFVQTDYSIRNFIPNFNGSYFASLSILVFALGGCEKVSPYVNKVKNPSKDFPKGMIVLAIMVVICAVFGTIAMSRMFDPSVINSSTETFNSYVANSPYWAFQKLGQYYHIGDFFLIIYSLCNALGQFSVLVLSIDAPLRMLLDNDFTKNFIPVALHKTNGKGVHVNGVLMVAVLSGSLILIHSFVPGAASVITQMTKLNSVCMPMNYMWVFVSYISLKRYKEKIPTDYRFVKNKVLGMFFGIWCFTVTATCCIMGMYDKDPFVLSLNITTPVVLTLLGIILPVIASAERKHGKNTVNQ